MIQREPTFLDGPAGDLQQVYCPLVEILLGHKCDVAGSRIAIDTILAPVEDDFFDKATSRHLFEVVGCLSQEDKDKRYFAKRSDGLRTFPFTYFISLKRR